MSVPIVRTVADLCAMVRQWRSEGASVAVVPTMGALHEGHASLIRRSRAENDRTLVSIFVNPTQFDDPRDLAAYPRTLDADLAVCRDAGVDVVFAPSAAEMYPEGAQTSVEVGALAAPLCGASPWHNVQVSSFDRCSDMSSL